MAWQPTHGTLQRRMVCRQCLLSKRCHKVCPLIVDISYLKVVGTKTKINLGRQREGGCHCGYA